MAQADEDTITGSSFFTNKDNAVDRLETLQLGLTTFGHLLNGFPLDDRVEITTEGLAAVVHTFAFAIEGALNMIAPKA